jgi:hypothetical protein
LKTVVSAFKAFHLSIDYEESLALTIMNKDAEPLCTQLDYITLLFLEQSKSFAIFFNYHVKLVPRMHTQPPPQMGPFPAFSPPIHLALHRNKLYSLLCAHLYLPKESQQLRSPTRARRHPETPFFQSRLLIPKTSYSGTSITSTASPTPTPQSSPTLTTATDTDNHDNNNKNNNKANWCNADCNADNYHNDNNKDKEDSIIVIRSQCTWNFGLLRWHQYYSM